MNFIIQVLYSNKYIQYLVEGDVIYIWEMLC